MFEGISDKQQRRRFILNSFVSLPIGLIFGLLISLGLKKLYNIEVSPGGMLLFVTIIVSGCIGAIFISYKKLSKQYN